MKDFIKVINPAKVKAWGSNGAEMSVNLWVCIKYKEGKLSITGVEGPKRNGDCFGSCGQCGVDPDASPQPGYTESMLKELRYVWENWHLNDMRPYSAAMKESGWNILAKTKVETYEFSLTMESYGIRKSIEKGAMEAAKNGESFVPTKAQTKVAQLPWPFSPSITVMEGAAEPVAPWGFKRKRNLHGGGDARPQSTTLGWTKPSEHPDGLLGRKHPSDPDGKGYGQQWWTEQVPDDVLEFLRGLPAPEGDLTTGWWKESELAI